MDIQLYFEKWQGAGGQLESHSSRLSPGKVSPREVSPREVSPREAPLREASLREASPCDKLSNCAVTSCASATAINPQWAHLREIKWRVDAGERLDPSVILSLRQQFRSVKRTLRLERREQLKKALTTTQAQSLKQAAQIRLAIDAVERGLNRLSQARERNRRKSIQSTHRPTHGLGAKRKKMGEEILKIAPMRETLIEQREAMYLKFHRAMIQLPWLKRGWPVDPRVDERGELVDARKVAILGSSWRQSEGVSRAFTALRWLDAQLDLYGLARMPQSMNHQQWSEFTTQCVQTALSSLVCCQGGCESCSEHIDGAGGLFCSQHAPDSSTLELAWMRDLWGYLQGLLDRSVQPKPAR